MSGMTKKNTWAQLRRTLVLLAVLGGGISVLSLMSGRQGDFACGMIGLLVGGAIGAAGVVVELVGRRLLVRNRLRHVELTEKKALWCGHVNDVWSGHWCEDAFCYLRVSADFARRCGLMKEHSRPAGGDMAVRKLRGLFGVRATRARIIE